MTLTPLPHLSRIVTADITSNLNEIENNDPSVSLFLGSFQIYRESVREGRDNLWACASGVAAL